ncbi:MAG: hypothetical protein ABSC90_04565 [Acidimicrobiales bacterium]
MSTTRHLCAAYPLASEAGLGHEGVLIGRDVLGGSFVYDPFVLYRNGVVTNPNALVLGQIGRGKSSFVKSYLWRQAVFGRHAWVVDPKGEYGLLAEAWGVRPASLRPGGPIRLNPLDTDQDRDGPSDPDSSSRDLPSVDPGDGARRQRMVLTSSLAVACLGRELLPRERAAIDVALAQATEQSAVTRMPAPTLPQVVEALLEPGLEASLALRTTRTALLEDGRDVALELRRLVHGDLCTPRPSACSWPVLRRGCRVPCGHDTVTGSSWWWTRPGPSCPTSVWRDGSRRRGRCRGPTGWPTWRSCTDCPTSGPWGRRVPNR